MNGLADPDPDAAAVLVVATAPAPAARAVAPAGRAGATVGLEPLINVDTTGTTGLLTPCSPTMGSLRAGIQFGVDLN